MPVWEASLGTRYNLRLTIDLVSQDVINNRSNVSWRLSLVQNGPYEGYAFGSYGWSVSVEGGQWSGSTSYDFRNYDELVLGSGNQLVTHNDNGTKRMAARGNFSGAHGSGEVYAELDLPTIARATTPTFSANPATIGIPVTINLNRASASFDHYVGWEFGNQSGQIASGVTTSATWTPPLSMISSIANSTTGTANIVVDTYASGTLIGRRRVPLTIAVPASVVPTIGDLSIVASPSNTTYPNVGAFVQWVTTLDIAINGAAGAYGSTITSYRIDVADQVINARTGITTWINQAGSAVRVRGTVTDSRGRTATTVQTINVLAYTAPTIDTAVFAVRRADASGTPVDDGAYFRIDLKASVKSLMVGGVEKNALKYRVLTRPRKGTTWTQAVNATVGGTSFNSYILTGTYLVDKAWEVMVEVSDNFKKTQVAGMLAMGKIFMHWGDGLGVGKYWERGEIDALGQIYQRGGKKVVDEAHAGVGYAQAAGTATFQTAIASGANATVAVSLPEGRFTQPPVIVVSTNQERIIATARNVSTSGFNLGLINWHGSASSGAPIIASWYAIQMTSGNAEG